jgi:hypothetical protein
MPGDVCPECGLNIAQAGRLSPGTPRPWLRERRVTIYLAAAIPTALFTWVLATFIFEQGMPTHVSFVSVEMVQLEREEDRGGPMRFTVLRAGEGLRMPGGPPPPAELITLIGERTAMELRRNDISAGKEIRLQSPDSDRFHPTVQLALFKMLDLERPQHPPSLVESEMLERKVHRAFKPSGGSNAHLESFDVGFAREQYLPRSSLTRPGFPRMPVYLSDERRWNAITARRFYASRVAYRTPLWLTTLAITLALLYHGYRWVGRRQSFDW